MCNEQTDEALNEVNKALTAWEVEIYQQHSAYRPFLPAGSSALERIAKLKAYYSEQALFQHDLWLDYSVHTFGIPDRICGLCQNYGEITVSWVSAEKKALDQLRPCFCPAGQSTRKEIQGMKL